MLYDRPEGCNKRRGQRRCRPTRGRPTPRRLRNKHSTYFPTPAELFSSSLSLPSFFFRFFFSILCFFFALWLCLALVEFFLAVFRLHFYEFLHFHDDAASAEGASSCEAAKIAVVCVCAKRHKWVKPGPMSERPIEGERQRE